MSKKIVNIQIKYWMKFKISIFKQYKQGKVQEAFRNHHKYFIFQSMITRSLLLVLLFSILAQSSIYDYSKCTSSQILNTKTLTCESCPANKESNRNQLVANECICKKGFYPASNSVCTEFYPSSSTSLCSSEQFINAFESTGAIKSVTGCSTCDSNAYQNTNGTSCTPCLTGMSYNSTNKKCQCINSTYTQTSLGCFPESYTASLGLTLSSSVYSARLKYLVPGCFYFKSPLSCSQLVNLCIYSLLSSGPECDFFTKAGMTSYIYSETTNVYSMAATSKDTEIKMKLISFTPEGNYAKEKDFRLADVMRCGLPSNADITVTIGSNIQVTCQFNFNNLLAQMAGKTYQNYLYQLLVQGQNGAYFEVNAYLNGNPQPVKRFFLEDTFTSTTSITVLTSFKFEMTLTTDNSLSKPSLYLTYTKLSLEPSTGITPVAQQKQAISYTIQFSSQLSSFWSVILPIFIVVNVLVIVHAAIKTYIEYLNRKTAFLFFLHFIDIWSLWMFYFLLLTTAYWFIFLKTTPNIYIFAPSQTTLYAAFYIVFGLMVAFRLISVLIEKAEKLKIQIFLINWEKEKAVNNSWREIFIVNSLAEFCTYRTFSVFWLLLVMLFFMIGLKWEQHAGEVVHTKLDQIEYFHKKNSVLLYFLSSSILLVIAIAFKILRRLTVLFWAYPFEDFVDYCSVTNISFFFMKKRSPETFYIHADLLQKTEVTFKELNNAVRSGLKKDRSLTNQINNRTKIYVTYVNRDLEEKFAQMLKKEEDHDSQRHLKYSVGSTVSLKPSMGSSKDPFSYRQEFIEKRLKPAIQQIRNKARSTKTIFQSFFHIPPEDLRNDRGLNENQVFLDENLDVVKQVFPNGDEFEELHTIIIIYLLWIIVTGSSPIAAFLTYFCDEWILNAWVASTYRKNLEKMTRVREGFML